MQKALPRFGRLLAMTHQRFSNIVSETRALTPDVHRLEKAARKAYDSRNLSYYDGYHPTSRYFDELIDAYLIDNPLPVAPASTWLETGSGRGRLRSAAGRRIEFSRFYLDISRLMLQQLDDVDGSAVLGSALRLPFRAASFDGVVAFLGDAFTTKGYFDEAHRVLKEDGSLLHIVPSATWGHILRQRLGYQPDETVFRGLYGDAIDAPSLLYDGDYLKELLRQAGFRGISVDTLHPL